MGLLLLGCIVFPFVVNDGSRVKASVKTAQGLCDSCSGARIKPRKRNIAVPNDPSGFADNVIQFFTDKDGDLVSVKLVFTCTW